MHLNGARPWLQRFYEITWVVCQVLAFVYWVCMTRSTRINDLSLSPILASPMKIRRCTMSKICSLHERRRLSWSQHMSNKGKTKQGRWRKVKEEGSHKIPASQPDRQTDRQDRQDLPFFFQKHASMPVHASMQSRTG